VLKDAAFNGLQELVLHGLGLTEIPTGLSHLVSLAWLDMGRNLISAVPAGALEPLVNLQIIGLTSNNLSALPALPRLSKLERLYLAGNQFKVWPETISVLSALNLLDLSDNQLTQLPPSISKLPASLRTLHLHRNRLTTVYPDLATVTTLHHLVLSANPLDYLPPRIAEMTTLQTLDISVCPAVSFPEPKRRRMEDIFEVLRKVQADSESYSHLKVRSVL
jgi:hypothetical protein